MAKLNLTVLFFILIAFSCKKDSGSSTPKDPGAILTSGKWQLTAATSLISASGVSQTIDVFSSLESCVKDNYYIFNSDGTATVDEGATKCDDSDPQTSSDGTWQLLNNNTQLKANDDMLGGDITADIKQLDNSTLIIQYVTQTNGANNTITITYTHIQ